MTAAPTQPRKRVVTVVFGQGTQQVSLTFPVMPGHSATLPAVVAAALCAEDPPEITITVKDAPDAF